MKRAEQLAWASLAGLLVIAGILLTGGILYHFTGFWAGMMLACGQAVTVGLAAWGLLLARQSEELRQPASFAGPGTGQVSSLSDASRGEFSGFRMSVGDDLPASATPTGEAKTLDTGFQRLVTALAALLLTLLAALTAYLVYAAYQWSQQNKDQPLPIAGTFAKPMWLDELGLVIGLGAAGIYGVFWWLTRVRRETEGYGDAVATHFTLGLPGMAALAVASLLGYFRVSFASELAAGVIAALMALQGFELFVNAFRSYSSIEELDQEAIDLQSLPLAPMLGSVWLSGLKMLFAQSVGLSAEGHKRDKGVIARLMPRALVAIFIIAVGVSCLRVVKPGEVAVLERLGAAPFDEQTKQLLPEAILYPGLHPTLPWPIDQLVTIPTDELRMTDVGTELHAAKAWKDIDFQFWTVRPMTTEDESDDLFITGDANSPQFLETYVQVWWRVTDPAKFYSNLSHSEFYEKTGTGTETRSMPIYEAIVQQCTSFAVTKTFAIHSLDQIMVTDRSEVERHCRDILQDKLDSLGTGSGIKVEFLTIKDLHPPFWHTDRNDPSKTAIGGEVRGIDSSGVGVQVDDQSAKMDRGPASAFENVVSMREWREQVINIAEARRIAMVNIAHGDAAAEIAGAQTYRQDRVARAHGDADRLVTMTGKMDPANRSFELSIMRRQLLYATLKDLLDPVNKIIVDPAVKDVQIYQTNDKGASAVRPPG